MLCLVGYHRNRCNDKIVDNDNAQLDQETFFKIPRAHSTTLKQMVLFHKKSQRVAPGFSGLETNTYKHPLIKHKNTQAHTIDQEV